MEEFFDLLQKCSTGERAALRRNCGRLLKDADGQAVTVFYRCLPREVPQWQEDRWFAAGCFSCLWDEDAKAEPLEAVFSRMKEDSDSMEHRLAAMLDLQWDADGYLLAKLCRIIKMVKSKGAAVDCESLLKDLIYWNSGSQSVQRKWARTMYMKKSIDIEEE